MFGSNTAMGKPQIFISVSIKEILKNAELDLEDDLKCLNLQNEPGDMALCELSEIFWFIFSDISEKLTWTLVCVNQLRYITGCRKHVVKKMFHKFGRFLAEIV